MTIQRIFHLFKNFLTDPVLRFNYLVKMGFYNRMSDEAFLKKRFRLYMESELNLNNPSTYSEKLQWLKLNDRNPEYTQMVDKYLAKQWVAQRIGEEYIIPTLGVWNSFDEIDFDSLPNQFVLKCTHDSGSLVICLDKNKFDKKRAKKKLERYLNHNYYYESREWPYKNVVPRIIAEEYKVDSSSRELRDYKFFTFNGTAKLLMIASDRQAENVETKFDFFDMNFDHLDFRNGHPNSEGTLPAKPLNFENMRRLSEEVSKGIPSLRVDFYEVDGKIFFGEMTFFHWGGMKPFDPEEWDQKLGDWIQLPPSSSTR